MIAMEATEVEAAVRRLDELATSNKLHHHDAGDLLTVLRYVESADQRRLDAVTEVFSVAYAAGHRDALHPEAASSDLADELTELARVARRLATEGASDAERAEHDRRKKRLLAMIESRDAEGGD